jgi:exopolysaccharide biosynthesis polyprenyl glycosylphosphotransferase
VNPAPWSADPVCGARPRRARSRAAPWLVAAEAVAVVASFYLAWRLVPVYRRWLVPGEQADAETLSADAWLLLLVLPVWLGLGWALGLLARTGRRPSWRELARGALRVAGWGVALLAVLIVAAKLVAVSRLVLFGFVALYVPASTAARGLALALERRRRRHPEKVERVVVIGTRERAREFIRRARAWADEEGGAVELVGCLDPEPAPEGGAVEGLARLGELGATGDFERVLFNRAVDAVVVAMPLEQVPRAAELVGAAVALGLRVAVLPDYGLHRLGAPAGLPEPAYEEYLGAPAALFSDVDWSPAYRLAKRGMDVAVSGALLVLLAPVLAAIALAIRLASPDGPVLYRWRVLGRNRRPVESYKFRTMVADADRQKPGLAAANQMRGPVFKMRADPRVTPLGRWLRRASLDELPQLWSVLKGDLSLVGPRPPFPAEAARYEFWQRRKLAVKPGITCLWQVNGRGEIADFDHWARLDLEYIRKASLGLDCWILLKTIPAVLRGRGAW